MPRRQQWSRAEPLPARAHSPLPWKGAPENRAPHIASNGWMVPGSSLLWNEVPSYDLKTKRDLSPAAAKVHLVLKEKSGVHRDLASRPGRGARAAVSVGKGTRCASAGRSDCPEHQARGRRSHPPAIAPPTAIEAKNDTDVRGTDAAIRAECRCLLGDAESAGIWGRRDGETDGKAHLMVPALIPATTYPFEGGGRPRLTEVFPAAREDRGDNTSDAFSRPGGEQLESHSGIAEGG